MICAPKPSRGRKSFSKISDLDALALRLEEILPEAFAVVKDTCRRLCGQEISVRSHPQKWEMIPFDVQLIGGIGLHRGRIAEMATGEGKTLRRHAARLSQCDYRAGRPRRDGERLSRRARCGMDGRDLQNFSA